MRFSEKDQFYGSQPYSLHLEIKDWLAICAEKQKVAQFLLPPSWTKCTRSFISNRKCSSPLPPRGKRENCTVIRGLYLPDLLHTHIRQWWLFLDCKILTEEQIDYIVRLLSGMLLWFPTERTEFSPLGYLKSAGLLQNVSAEQRTVLGTQLHLCDQIGLRLAGNTMCFGRKVFTEHNKICRTFIRHQNWGADLCW